MSETVRVVASAESGQYATYWEYDSRYRLRVGYASVHEIDREKWERYKQCKAFCDEIEEEIVASPAIEPLGR